jgi:hypothetical protein
VVGAYSKLHVSRTMNLPDTSVGGCQNLDASGQIACLVQADRCSIGFAGRGAEVGYNVDALKLKNVAPTDANLLSFAYPMTRKLYLNQVIPASVVWGTERAYEACYVNSCKTVMSARGFLGVDPYCEDFNEQVLCGAGPNSTAGCDAKRALYPSLGPTVVCGDGSGAYPGTPGLYEECDMGSSNTDTCVSGTTICTTACRAKVCL